MAETADILVVDDDPDFAESLGELLRLEGHRVAVALDQEQALRAAADRPPAVALIDVRLGTASGIDLLRALLSRYPDLVAVMVTGYATVEASVEALQSGAYDYLRKPFLTDDLLATLARCLERRHLHHEKTQAEAALQARNQELEALNARLARVLASLSDLSRGSSWDAAASRLLDVLSRELDAVGGGLYRGRDAFLCLETCIGTGLPERLDWPLAPTDHHLATFDLPIEESAAGARAMIVLAKAAGGPFSRQDVEIGTILASFGAEAMRRAGAVESLARSEQRLRDIVQNSPSAIALEDLEGKCLLANERFGQWFCAGSAPAPVADRDSVGRGTVVSAEIDLDLGAGGNRRILVTRFPVCDSSGRPVGIGTIATDVTERHEAEERLRHAQRMEALGRLTGGVAHDFNNLLAVVLGNLMLIEEQCRDQPDLVEMIDDALDATRSGVELTSRLLAFGRRQPLHPEITDIREQVLGTARLLGRTLGERITIRLDLAPDTGLVHLDRSQLDASLLNLALNARDAMADGGSLAITVHEVELDGAAACADHLIEPGHYVALSVADTGHGMAPEILQRAVQPFFTTKAAGAGSGLGLSIVHGFVHQSGGHLAIDSASGTGTTVTLYFPLADPHGTIVPSDPIPTAKVPQSLGERVLVVEDQPRVRLLVRRQLERLGYAVVDVGDAGTALDRLADPRIRVLLTDVVLPGDMDGVRLAEEALARRPDLALVLTTGYAPEGLAARTRMLATVPILPKPFAPDQLARALREAIDARRPVQARAEANM